MKSRSLSSRIIAHKKNNHYLGVALDFDLMVQADSLQKALKELKHCIESYLVTCVDENENEVMIYPKADPRSSQAGNAELQQKRISKCRK